MMVAGRVGTFGQHLLHASFSGNSYDWANQLLLAFVGAVAGQTLLHLVAFVTETKKFLSWNTAAITSSAAGSRNPALFASSHGARVWAAAPASFFDWHVS